MEPTRRYKNVAHTPMCSCIQGVKSSLAMVSIVVVLVNAFIVRTVFPLNVQINGWMTCDCTFF